VADLYVTAAIGAVSAGADSGRIAMPTPFDAGQRRVTGVQCSNTTKGRTIVLDANGAPMVTIDLGTLGRMTSFVPCDFVVPSNIQLSFLVKDNGAGALVAGDFVTLRYST
jgi:hypothetical protein